MLLYVSCCFVSKWTFLNFCMLDWSFEQNMFLFFTISFASPSLCRISTLPSNSSMGTRDTRTCSASSSAPRPRQTPSRPPRPRLPPRRSPRPRCRQRSAARPGEEPKNQQEDFHLRQDSKRTLKGVLLTKFGLDFFPLLPFPLLAFVAWLGLAWEYSRSMARVFRRAVSCRTAADFSAKENRI